MTTARSVSFGILGAGMIADDRRQAIEADVDARARLVTVGHHDPRRGDAVAAASAGQHVLVKEPMATRVADAEAMIRACDDAGTAG